MSVQITGVVKGSPAYMAHLQQDDVLISINGNEISDVLDYMFYAAEERLELRYISDSTAKSALVIKSEYDDLGLEFATYLMDDKQSCRNKCVFCFIDQMPQGMRETLYFKDDDARLSFLHGNYITLTNLKQSDVDRIIKMRINVNVSVHTTNPELRAKMMNNRFAGQALDYIYQMAAAGIKLNCQLVLCPGLNDGDELRRSLSDLGGLFPNMQSIAAVPVGLTKYRQGLYELQGFTKESAGAVIDIIEEYQQRFLRDYGERLVFPADEFFLLAERDMPPYEYYEEFSQYENGVGMTTMLNDGFMAALEHVEAPDTPRTFSIVTGKAAYKNINMLVEIAHKRWHNLNCKVYAIENEFFGSKITVAGLLTAGDIINQLRGRELGERLLLPSVMIKQDTDLFLDDLTIGDVERALEISIHTVRNDGEELLRALLY